MKEEIIEIIKKDCDLCEDDLCEQHRKLPDQILTILKERLLEKMPEKKNMDTVYFHDDGFAYNRDKGYNQALEDIIKIIKDEI